MVSLREHWVGKESNALPILTQIVQSSTVPVLIDSIIYNSTGSTCYLNESLPTLSSQLIFGGDWVGR